MGSFDWGLEIVLIGFLLVTLVHAIRLERALKHLRADRAALGDAISGFDDSARLAEAGIGRLHSASAEAAQALTQRVEQGASLKDDLAFLIERGEALADQMDTLIRAARPMTQQAPVSPPPAPVPAPSPAVPAAVPNVRSQAERDLLLALQAAR